MTMMLTGKTEPARSAKSLGLVDAVTQERHVRAAVIGRRRPESLKPARQGFVGKAAEHGAAARPRRVAACGARPRRRPTKANYPAPFALIDLWEKHGDDAAAMQKAEITSFAGLMVGDTSRNLVRVFFLRENLKSLADGSWDGQRVHVIGAGAMGGDIAAWCAWHGFTVSLGDTKTEPVAGAIKRAAELFGKIGRRNRRDIRDALDRLIPDLKGDGVATADLIIEAVPEKLELKQKVFAGVEAEDEARRHPRHQHVEHSARAVAHRPEKSGPARRHPLLQSGVAHATGRSGHARSGAEKVLEEARAFLGRIDRLPAPVKSAPGFLVNRALTPYLLEAMVMLDQGMKKETIDEAAEAFGMPMGPIELADQVGLDICLHVAEMLKANLSRKMPDPPQWLKRQGRQRRAWQEDRQRPLRLEGRPRRQAARGCRGAARHDRSPDPADARRLRDLPARRASSPTRTSSTAP